MRFRPVRCVLAVLFAVVAAGCGMGHKAPVVDVAAVNAAVDSLDNALAGAVAARDTAAILSLYADGAMMLPAGMHKASGRDAIRALWVGFLRMPGLELAPQSRQVIVSEAGDLAIDIGTYQMKYTGPKGKTVNDIGKYVTIFRKTAAGWKVIVDTYNSDVPAR
jgi:uncharacterized protein (TIGR02246 family)